MIKDHHKGVPVTNLSFCDLVSGSHSFQQVQKAQSKTVSQDEVQNPYDLEGQAESEKQKQYEAMTEWLFISMDVEGKVIIGHVFTQYMFYRYKKFIIIEP